MGAVNLEAYLQLKKDRHTAVPRSRSVCYRCNQAGFGCYCEFVKPFAADMKFVILIHPIEVKRRIATGRMAHLCLKDSELIQGQEFSNSIRVQALTQDEKNHCVVLYPGDRSVNLTALTPNERKQLIPDGKKLVIFVIDGTWNTAGRMIRSTHLKNLPRISFDADAPSRFRVRKQPMPECLSTIEAIHKTIELYSPETNDHDNLLDVFDQMVEFQLKFTEV